VVVEDLVVNSGGHTVAVVAVAELQAGDSRTSAVVAAALQQRLASVLRNLAQRTDQL
jgi:hypothetical protein